MDDIIVEKIFTYYNTRYLAGILGNILNIEYNKVKIVNDNVLKVNETRYQIIEKQSKFILKPF
jgi:hypothetical protein